MWILLHGNLRHKLFGGVFILIGLKGEVEALQCKTIDVAIEGVLGMVCLCVAKAGVKQTSYGCIDITA